MVALWASWHLLLQRRGFACIFIIFAAPCGMCKADMLDACLLQQAFFANCCFSFLLPLLAMRSMM